MNSLRLFLTGSVLTALMAGSLYAQAVGDYGSKASGNWGTDGTNWIVCTSPGTWSGATDPAPAAPSQTTNVWIRAGHTVTAEASGKNSLNLVVESGASLVGSLAHPTGTIHYVRVYGTAATINGVFGASAAPGTNIALEPATTGTTVTIGGSGTFGPSRVRMNSGASAVTLVFNINTTFYYTGSGGTGGVALYPQTDDNVFTINAGRTVTFVPNAGLGVGSGAGSFASTNLIVNINGIVNMPSDSSSLTLKVSAGKTAALTVASGASLTVGGDVFASTVADGGTTTMAVHGTMTVGGTVDFSNPGFVVSGTGSFTVPAATRLVIGHPAGITSAGGTGQIQTSTRSFSSSAGYTYAGSAAQVTGSGLPTSVGSLALDNTAGTSLTNAVTVNDSLVFTNGNLITGANTVTIGASGTVRRTSGHVAGTLRKNVAAGLGVARSFEIGSGSTYAPVNILFSGVSTPGTLTASTTAGDHPNLGTSAIDGAKSVNRYWTLTNGGIVFTTFDGTFGFAASDLDAGAHPGVFTGQRYSGAWSGLTEGSRTSTSTEITGATAFSDFAVGEEIGAPPTPAFELSTGALAFGSVNIGNTPSDTVVVRNIGTAALNISSITSTNTPVFTVVPAGANVAVGDSVGVIVTFAPAASGSASADIVFLHNGAGSPDTLDVSGSGTNAGAIMSNGTGGGEWGLTTTWQGGIVPGNLDSVLILASDSVFVAADGEARGIRVQSGARVGLGDTLEVDHATVFGTVVAHADSRFNVIDDGTFENGSVYHHAREGGNMPVVTWEAGSTFLMTGVVSVAPASGNQSYHHIIWNAPGHLSNINLGWDSITIGGNITILNTGVGRWQMTAPASSDSAWVVINGSIIQSGGNFTSHGSSNANTKIVIDVYGDILVTGGNFSVCRGSQPGGTTTWNMHGDFTMSDATTQNSNNSGARFVFADAGPQTLSLSNVTFASSTFNVSVNGTSALDMGASVIPGTGSFILNPGATLSTGHAGGISGAVTCTGANGGGNLFSTTANYVFNGTAPQVTGTLLPDFLNNLTISNSTGVACSDSFQVNGILAVTAGDLDLNGKIITLGSAAVLAETPGNTVGGSSGVITTTRTLVSPVLTNDIGGLGIMIGSSANLGSTVLTRGHAVQTANAASIKRFVDITPANNTGLNATLKLRYDESELNGTDEPTLLLYKSTDNGASWTLAGGTVNTAANTIEVGGVGDLSRWTPAGDLAITVSLSPGWNMISNPVTTSDDSVRQLFPNAGFAYAFSFEGAGGYQQRFVMDNGRGYWEKFPVAEINPFTGLLRSADTVAVSAGWNMLGSLSLTVDTSQVDDPAGIRSSVWFGYNGGYFAATQIVPGKGYWVKASAAGSFIYSTDNLAKTPVREDPLANMNSVTITDRTGASQTLYFAAGGELTGYDMPPIPPAGAFDVRFESTTGGSLARVHAVSTSPVDMPVTLQSASYPLTVSWNVTGGDYELSAGSPEARPMTGEGTVVLHESINRLIIRAAGSEELPASFGLAQNYPNPFNPATNIRFALPVESRVTMDIYNALGQQVRTLVNENRKAGYHLVEWNGTGNAGQALGSGMYFLRIHATGGDGQSFTHVRKMMLMK